MKLRLSFFKTFMILIAVFSQQAFAELTIEINQGVDNPTKIAVVPFLWQGNGLLDENVSGVVEADLRRSGLFSTSNDGFLSQPHSPADVVYRDWRALGVEYLLIGKIIPVSGPKPYRISYQLYDVNNENELINQTLDIGEQMLRDGAHYISDRVFEKITGVRGAFKTKILYVSASKDRNGKRDYQLLLSDADGARQFQVLRSDEPILSAAWAPNGKEIAYVSFEHRRPSIYRQVLATGERERLTNFKGLNGAPAWSPDGTKLAMVLSKDGNPEIYVMELATRKLQRVTKHYGIDTEPAWMPDGKSLLFTSSRGGKPQIYRVNLASGAVERVTYIGDYNARPIPLNDGRSVIMVHQNAGSFHIAVQNLDTGNVDVLTQTTLDESPSVAPNASMVIYATQRQGKGVLAVVSIDGRVKLFLPAKFQDVREPAWSPFM